MLEYKSMNNDFSYRRCVYADPGNAPFHFNPDYEIYHFISGDITYYIEGFTYELVPGDTFIISNRELHKPVYNHNGKHEFIVVHLNPSFISHFQTDGFELMNCFVNRKPGYANKIPATVIQDLKVDDMFQEMEQYIQSEHPESPIMIKLIFIKMLVMINKYFLEHNHCSPYSISSDKKISMVLEYINSNLLESISLDSLASRFFLNKHYLCRQFKKVTGFSLIEYINCKRILKVQETLEQGFSVTEAFNQSGFNEYSNFYKVFRRVTGTSPSAYIKR